MLGSLGPVTAEGSQQPYSFTKVHNLPGSRIKLENGF